MKEAENVLKILRETRKLIGEDDAHEIKNLSNRTIHSAAIYQDADNVMVAVLVYSISKILERENYREMEGWKKIYSSIVRNLDLSIVALEKKQIKNWRTYIGRIRNDLNKITGRLGGYVKDIFRKAEINKAFKLYEHGLSSEQTAQLFGVSLWDLASYIGQSSIGDASMSISMPAKQRVKIAEDIFG